MRGANVCLQGDKVTLPLCALGSQRDGWTVAPTPSNGVVLMFDSNERGAGGAFVPEWLLKDWVKHLNILKRKKETKPKKRKKRLTPKITALK